MTMFSTNKKIYIPFVGEQYNEEDIHNAFLNLRIGRIRSIIFVEHNYMIGTLDMGSVEEVWGRPAIIEIEHWESNDLTRSLNFSMNAGMTRSCIEFDGPDGDYWLIQKYKEPASMNLLPEFLQENVSSNNEIE